jgi:transketolase
MPTRTERANAIRGVSAFAVDQAKCNHPGMSIRTAKTAEALFSNFPSHDHVNPGWVNRDQFFSAINKDRITFERIVAFTKGSPHALD